MSDAFLFAGQGAQYVGMGADLAEMPTFVEAFEMAEAALGVPLLDIVLEGPLDRLTLTENAQPAILLLGVLHERLARKAGAEPKVLLGHSLGEFAAWTAAGSLELTDALRLVQLRGRAMQEAVPVGVGAMSAIISAATDVVEGLCAAHADATGEVVCVAVMNCPGNVVISGHVGAVGAVSTQIADGGHGMVRPLSVSAPFHTPLLMPAAERLAEAITAMDVQPNRVAVIPNVTAELAAPGTDPDQIRRWLVEQVVAPVRWEESLRAALDAGVQRAFAMGPGTMQRSHLKRISRRFPLVAMDKEAERSVFLGGGA
jgi:[acyl-carrier-protein] S-malonyltransferase